MELFAADGHDAGGCERVTGKSGMRPAKPSRWACIGHAPCTRCPTRKLLQECSAKKENRRVVVRRPLEMSRVSQVGSPPGAAHSRTVAQLVHVESRGTGMDDMQVIVHHQSASWGWGVSGGGATGRTENSRLAGAVHFTARPRLEAGHIAGLDADRPSQFSSRGRCHQSKRRPLSRLRRNILCTHRRTGPGRRTARFMPAGWPRTREHERLVQCLFTGPPGPGQRGGSIELQASLARCRASSRREVPVI